MEKLLIDHLRSFRAVTDEDSALITSYFTARTYAAGDFLFAGNKPCNEMYFVLEGILRIVSANDKGVERTHYFYKEGQFCSILSSFTDGSHAEAAIRAASDASVLSITRTKLQELCTRLPYMKEVIDEVIRRRLVEKINIRNLYIGEDAEAQYRLFMTHQPDIAARVPQKDIASFLGITPQSLSRIRKNLSR